jgi:hypothetical protein
VAGWHFRSESAPCARKSSSRGRINLALPIAALLASAPEPAAPITKRGMDADERKTLTEANEARRQSMRNLLYRKDS